MDEETRKPVPEGLEYVGGALVPSDRAAEEKRNLKRTQEFIQRYGNPKGVAKLEERVRAAEKSLDEWSDSNPSARKYLDAIETWKKGWDPVFPEDAEDAKKAEFRMREIEKDFGIQYSDISLILSPEEELKEKGYTDEQIRVLRTIAEGKKLEAALDRSRSDFNRIRSLLSRK